MKTQTVFFDMDGVLVDFQSGIDKLDEATKTAYAGRLDEVPGIFGLMEPMPGALDAVHRIAEKYEVFILSTAPWLNPSAWADKIQWLHKYFGADERSLFYKKVIITHQKNRIQGDFLIDDRTKWGADQFPGSFLQFGSAQYPDWDSILRHLLPGENAAQE